jgi:hypothetical protein
MHRHPTPQGSRRDPGRLTVEIFPSSLKPREEVGGHKSE